VLRLSPSPISNKEKLVGRIEKYLNRGWQLSASIDSMASTVTRLEKERNKRRKKVAKRPAVLNKFRVETSPIEFDIDGPIIILRKAVETINQTTSRPSVSDFIDDATHLIRHTITNEIDISYWNIPDIIAVMTNEGGPFRSAGRLLSITEKLNGWLHGIQKGYKPKKRRLLGSTLTHESE
jgi:hypothetical protein